MHKRKVKILVVGCPKSGKSALITNYVSDELNRNENSCDFVIKDIIVDNIDVSVQLWEMCKKEISSKTFAEKTDALVLVSDLTSVESIVGLNEIYNSAKSSIGFSDNSFPVLLIGNKIDLQDPNTEITLQGLKRWASCIWPNKPSNLFYMETSNKDTVKIKQAFDSLIEYVCRTPPRSPLQRLSSFSPFSPASTTSSRPSSQAFSFREDSISDSCFYSNPLLTKSGTSSHTSTSIKHDIENTSLSSQHSTLTIQQQRAINYANDLPHMTEQERQDDEDSTINIVIAGACYVGKTCILSTFMGDECVFQHVNQLNNSTTVSDNASNTSSSSHASRRSNNQSSDNSSNGSRQLNTANEETCYEYEPTIGVDFRTYYEMPVRDINMKLQIWDASGNPAIKSIVRTIYRDADGLILVYDITDETSFKALDAYLVDYLQCRESYANENIDDYAVLLVGNKGDLSGRRAVSLERVMEWCTAKRHRKPIIYIESSALRGLNVHDIFVCAADEIYDYVFEDDDDDIGDGRGELSAESDVDMSINRSMSEYISDYEEVTSYNEYNEFSANEQDFTESRSVNSSVLPLRRRSTANSVSSTPGRRRKSRTSRIHQSTTVCTYSDVEYSGDETRVMHGDNRNVEISRDEMTMANELRRKLKQAEAKIHKQTVVAKIEPVPSTGDLSTSSSESNLSVLSVESTEVKDQETCWTWLIDSFQCK